MVVPSSVVEWSFCCGDIDIRLKCLSVGLQDRRISRDSRSRRTDTVNQERILKHLSTKESPSNKPADDESDDTVESPRHLSYVKKYRRYEG